MINIDWDDAMDYCQWLSEQTGRAYRLPSEAEWEYACRAGTASPFYFGATISTVQAKFQNLGKTVPVGQFPANAWGLHDMHGNVWEWTGSAFDENYTGSEKSLLTAEVSENIHRAIRGGSWYNQAAFLRSSSRNQSLRNQFDENRGFRLACSLDGDESAKLSVPDRERHVSGNAARIPSAQSRNAASAPDQRSPDSVYERKAAWIGIPPSPEGHQQVPRFSEDPQTEGAQTFWECLSAFSKMASVAVGIMITLQIFAAPPWLSANGVWIVAVESLAGVLIFYAIVWFSMKGLEVISISWVGHLLGLGITTLITTLIKLNAMFIFGGSIVLGDPAAPPGLTALVVLGAPLIASVITCVIIRDIASCKTAN